jgi:hypothetical protein
VSILRLNCNIISMNLLRITFKDSVPASQKTACSPIAKIDWILLIEEIASVYLLYYK